MIEAGLLTIESIRYLFRQGKGLHHTLAYDDQKKESKIQWASYQHARALHWALMNQDSFGWIDSEEEAYLEKIGVNPYLLVQLGGSAAVEYWIGKMERGEPLNSPDRSVCSIPFGCREFLGSGINLGDTIHFIEGAVAIFEKEWPKYLQNKEKNPKAPILDVRAILCFDLSLPWNQNGWFDLEQLRRFFLMGGPDICAGSWEPQNTPQFFNYLQTMDQ